MKKSEFIEKLNLFNDLKEQLKSLGKVKDGLRDEIKGLLERRKTDLFEIGEFRIVLTKYERKSLDIKRLVREEEINIDKYYDKKEYTRLDVVKRSMGMMEDISK